MPRTLLAVPLQRQLSEGDCLAACVAMVLRHLDCAMDYEELLRLLRIRSYGAPAGNVRRLEAQGLRVVYSQTDLMGLDAILQQGDPVIAFVRTGELPYWSHATDHALVVVGCDESRLYVNDPACDEAPIAVPRDAFELAWLERDCYYARITRPES